MSKPEKSPAFQFYPKDFLTDDKVMEMSAEVRGMYITLLCVDWLNDGFYGSAILKLGGFEWLSHDGALRDDSQDIKDQLLNCFEPHPTKEGFVTNPRLQKERAGQAERKVERSKAGKKGADKKWAELHASHAPADGSAIVQPMAKNGSSSSSPSSSSLERERVSEPPKFIPSLDTPECREILSRWIDYQATTHKKHLSEMQISSFQQLYSGRPEELIRDVNYTISHGYKTICIAKESGKNTNGPPKHESFQERERREFKERLARFAAEDDSDEKRAR